VISWWETQYSLPIDEIDIAEQDFVSVTAIVAFIDRESPSSLRKAA
jgi:hypothetical protein